MGVLVLLLAGAALLYGVFAVRGERRPYVSPFATLQIRISPSLLQLVDATDGAVRWSVAWEAVNEIAAWTGNQGCWRGARAAGYTDRSMRVLGGVAMMAAVFALSCANAGDTEDTEAPDAAVVAEPADAAPSGGCGDGTCDIGAGECSACPVDCTGVCGGGGGEPDAGAVCGDNVCNGDESCDWCAFDCGACPGVCGDGTCSVDEDCASCEADCGECPTSSCGDLVCDMAGGECASCPADCLGLCGGGGGPCAHDKCEIGGPLASDCDPCVEVICSLDFYCCLVEWDVSCKNAVSSACAESC